MKSQKTSDLLSAIKMGELTLIDAMIFQEVLAKVNGDIPTLASSLAISPVKTSLANAWEKVLDIDYVPIFKMAHEIILKIPSSPGLEDALKILAFEAQKIASSKVLLRHDLMGRIYHRLLMSDIAKYHATYYTSVPAAYLLARFALSADNDKWQINWSSLESVTNFKVADLACGSGTLLSSSYSAILDKYVTKSAENDLEPDTKNLHKILLEKVISGFDVLSYAAHLTAVTIALHNPSSLFNTTNIYTLPLGVINNKPKLGSIDLLESFELLPTVSLAGAVLAAPERKGLASNELSPVTVENLDLIIMNPPFTRSVGGNLLFGGLPKKERKVLQAHMAQLLKEKNFSGIGQAGLGAVFIAVADRCLKPGGRLAFVLPRSLISGVSWRKMRDLLAEKYFMELIVTSYQAPNDWNFSENTDLSEILFVARKRNQETEEAPQKTIIANFWKKPRNEMESIVVAGELIELSKTLSSYTTHYDIFSNANASHFDLLIGEEKLGEAYSVSSDIISDNTDTWGKLTPFAQSQLNRLSYSFISSGQWAVPYATLPLKPLSEILEKMGPDRRQIHGAFTVSKSPNEFKALWEHDSKYVTKINLSHNAFLQPKPGQTVAAQNLWESGKGRLMLAERLWLITNKVVALYLSDDALSNVWWPAKLKQITLNDGTEINQQDHEKIQSLWINSTFGLVAVLSFRQDTRGAWISLKKETWLGIPFLDIADFSKTKIDNLLKLYSSSSDVVLPPIPGQIQLAVKKQGLRYEVDKSFMEIVAGKAVDLTPFYEMLAREPIISLKPLT